MNKIEKFLRKLDGSRRDSILELIYKIKLGDLDNLDIKKLKGKESLFRVRKGSIRIIFLKTESKYEIMSIDNRDENTY